MGTIFTHSPPASFGIGFAVFTLLIVVLVILLAMVLARKLYHSDLRRKTEDWDEPADLTDSSAAFMAASMQGVIEKLRTQEKELARLHFLAQERAQESERLTEELTRHMPTGLLLVTPNGAISSANPAAEESLAAKRLIYRSYRDILGSDSSLSRMLSACLRDGTSFQREEIEHLTAQGETRRLGVTISPILRTIRKAVKATPPAAGESKVSGALCLISDLTELRALQKQIRWKENLAALGEMSAGIAHEFREALATISGYATMMRDELAPGDTRDSAERILDETRSLAHTVAEFLKVAKPLGVSFEPVPVANLVERVASELQAAIPDCHVDRSGTFYQLPGDPALIRQALLNLMRNAAEAARTIGRPPQVGIAGSIEELGGRKWQRICISDNGPGIPDQDLPNIFFPFYTTKQEGHGVGLSVVQKVALQHGGSVEARNRPGGGADFMLWLPLRQEVVPSLFPSEAARI